MGKVFCAEDQNVDRMHILGSLVPASQGKLDKYFKRKYVKN